MRLRLACPPEIAETNLAESWGHLRNKNNKIKPWLNLTLQMSLENEKALEQAYWPQPSKPGVVEDFLLG